MATLETVMRACRGELLAAARRMSFDATAAEDLVQETFARAWQYRASLVGENPRAWLFKILKNCFLETVSRKRRESERAFLESLYGVDACNGGLPQQTQSPGGDDLSNEVLDALGALEPELRAVIIRTDLMGQRYRDVAEALDLPIGTVMSRLHRARTRASAALAAYADTEYGIRQAERRGSISEALAA